MKRFIAKAWLGLMGVATLVMCSAGAYYFVECRVIFGSTLLVGLTVWAVHEVDE